VATLVERVQDDDLSATVTVLQREYAKRLEPCSLQLMMIGYTNKLLERLEELDDTPAVSDAIDAVRVWSEVIKRCEVRCCATP
jgi:hypothetical protein